MLFWKQTGLEYILNFGLKITQVFVFLLMLQRRCFIFKMVLQPITHTWAPDTHKCLKTSVGLKCYYFVLKTRVSLDDSRTVWQSVNVSLRELFIFFSSSVLNLDILSACLTVSTMLQMVHHETKETNAVQYLTQLII